MFTTQVLHIKGMVCQRCISTVAQLFTELGIPTAEVKLGQVVLGSPGNFSNLAILSHKLQQLGFSLLEDKKATLLNEIKDLVKEVYSGDYDFPYNFRFSILASNRLKLDYDAISAAFSAQEKITLEKYIINFRIEKVKEFLVYSTDTLDDISFKLGFSSMAHLSRQFKQVTGISPSYFRSLRSQKASVALS